MIAQKNDETG